jgi:pyruvate dehydrogenase E1 component alpha subunit
MPADLSLDTLLALYERMARIRTAEERLGAEFAAGNLPGSPHLYVGQEAVAVGICAQLSDADWVASTHRGHGHYLAKGGDLNAMFAEVYGRATGICRGMGGSMHVADFSKGIIGANGIVGAGIPLALGAALAAQLDGRGAVGVAFFGDGAANQGVLAESLNLCGLWKLPMLFVCENNGWSEFSSSASVTAGVIAERAAPYGVASEIVDGNDVAAVWATAERALARARAGEGATLIEAQTYRLRGHVEAEKHFLSKPYRDEAEVERWRERDPLVHARRLAAARGATEARLAALDAAVAGQVDAAVAFATASPFPDVALATELAV